MGCRRCGGEGYTCRCLARARAQTHTHTHSLTLPAERAGALPCTHVLITERARACSVSWGRALRGGVAGFQSGKPEDEDMESDTNLAAVQKGPKFFMHVLYCHMHIYATLLHILHI